MKILLSLFLLVFTALAVASIDTKNTDGADFQCAHLSGIAHNMSADDHANADCHAYNTNIISSDSLDEILIPVVAVIPSMIDISYTSITLKVTTPPPTA
jgi:hypothetical protein